MNSIDTLSKAAVLEQIYAKNPKLSGIVEILGVQWAKKTVRLGKKVALLHVSVAEPEQANILIDQGLL